MLTILKNFESFVIIFGVYGSLLVFHQAPEVEKESGAEGEEEIGDSQEPVRIILYIYQLSISYGLKKKLIYNFISISYNVLETTLLYSLDVCHSEIFSSSLKYFTLP